MLVTIVFAEKSYATEIHFNVVALKILQMSFATPYSISTKLQKNKPKLIHE